MAAAHTIKPEWFSIEGAALYTGFSVGSIRIAIKKRRFPIRRVPVTGGEDVTDPVRIKREWLDAWCDGQPMDESESDGLGGELSLILAEIRALRRQLERSGAYPWWMKVADTSRHCGLSVRTLKRRVSEGCFVSKWAGSVLLIDRESLDAWIERQTLER